MPIKAPNVGRKTYVGIQSASFNVVGNGTANFLLPITGPKTIKKIVIVTDDNTGVASLTAQPLQVAGGSALGAAKDIKKAANTVVEWNTSDLTSTSAYAAACSMSSTFKGLNLLVTAGGAGAFGFKVQVLYCDLVNRYGVPTNTDVAGVA